MAKLTLKNITSGYQTQDAYNANNDLIEAAIENTLSRDGAVPNNMNADIDLNSFNLNNINKLNATQIVLDGVLIGSFVATGAVNLLGLTDVNSSTPTSGNFLIADGVDWESRALLEADISDFQTYSLPGDDVTTFDGTADRMLYIDSSGDVQELTIGTSSTVLTSNGPTSAPSFQANIAVSLIGGVVPFATEVVPTGWLECDGSTVSRNTFAALFAIIGTIFGIGDGSTSFEIPDLRGEFIRGWDNSAGIDPDAGSRTDSGDGSTTGDNVGTKQAQEIGPHTHTQNGANAGAGGVVAFEGRDNIVFTETSSQNSGSESRPRNVYMMNCIKF